MFDYSRKPVKWQVGNFSKKIGALTASNYIYLNPVSTMITSGIVLHERMTWMACLGSILIFMGVYLANKGIPQSNK